MGGSIGAMVERLTIRQNTPSTDTHGARNTANWSTLDTIDVEMVPLSGAERLDAGRIGSKVEYRFRAWARHDITAKMRAEWSPAWPSGAPRQTLEIAAIVPDPGDRAFMFLDCSSHDGQVS